MLDSKTLELGHVGQSISMPPSCEASRLGRMCESIFTILQWLSPHHTSLDMGSNLVQLGSHLIQEKSTAF